MSNYIELDLSDDDLDETEIMQLVDKWREFCHIQAMNGTAMKEETLKRFGLWLSTGDPDDAWS